MNDILRAMAEAQNRARSTRSTYAALLILLGITAAVAAYIGYRSTEPSGVDVDLGIATSHADRAWLASGFSAAFALILAGILLFATQPGKVGLRDAGPDS